MAGSFGGGQGQILFCGVGTGGRQLFRYDLASREIYRVYTLDRQSGRNFGLAGGVTRANDGTLLVADYAVSLNDVSRLYHLAPDGAVIRSHDLDDTVVNGVSLSPDGRTAAYVDFTSRANGSRDVSAWSNDVCLVDLASARSTRIRLVEPDLSGLPADLRDIEMAQTVWAPDGTLYALATTGLWRVDLASETAIPLHVVALDRPDNSVVSQDGREIWFECIRDGVISKRIWSMDIASGTLTARSLRSYRNGDSGGGHFAPGFSPDGQWLLMQDVILQLSIGVASYHYIAAVRGLTPPFDTSGQWTEIRDADRNRFTASGRMAWY